MMDLRVLKMDKSEHSAIKVRNVKKPVTMHLHSYYELEMVMQGTGRQNLNGTVYDLQPGSIYFLTPIDFHAITPTTPMEVVNLSFDETALSPRLRLMFMNRRENYSFPPESPLNETLKTLFTLLRQEFAQQDEHSLQCRRDLLEVLLCTLLRGAGGERTVSAQVHRSMQYLFQHFREDITLEQIAQQSGYTPNYFSTLFHESTGEKFVDFLGNLRLNYAKMLLVSTDLTITEVAEKSGFGSAAAMYRKFKKSLGIPPGKSRIP